RQRLLGSCRFLLVLGTGTGRPGGLGRLVLGLVLGSAGVLGGLVGFRSLVRFGGLSGGGLGGVLGLRGLGGGVLGGFLGLRGLCGGVFRGFLSLGVVFGLSVVIACGLFGRARVEAPGAVLVVVGLRRARSARFRRLLGFGLRGLRRVGLGRSLRRRLRRVAIIGWVGVLDSEGFSVSVSVGFDVSVSEGVSDGDSEASPSSVGAVVVSQSSLPAGSSTSESSETTSKLTFEESVSDLRSVR